MNLETYAENEKVTTNLYSIIESIEEELKSNEVELIPAIIQHMIDSGQIKLTCESESCGYLLN